MKIPSATYRIQFSADFTFKDALSVVDYLSNLGGPWIYASPIFEARRGSAHGYDVVNPTRLNPELGAEADFEELIGRLKDKDMGWLQDAVPNHMAYTGDNPMLSDLFALGRASAFARFFDVDWRHPAEALSGRVAAPFLGDRLEACLERREIRPAMRDGTFGAVYYDHFFAFRLSSYALLDPEAAGADLPGKVAAEWGRTVRELSRMDGEPPAADRDARIFQAKEKLRSLAACHAPVAEFVDAQLQALDPAQGGPGARGALRRLLNDQVFRLRHWRTATAQINYRRFFDINELICLRQEDREVFDHTHRLLAQLAAADKIDGLRIDHIDGLRDPAQYLRRLREECQDVYLIVEKILGPDEPLPLSWPVEGTSGYEFADRTTRLFCRKDKQDRLDEFYRNFTGRSQSFARVCRDAKKQVLKDAFDGDLDNLVGRIHAADDLHGTQPTACRDLKSAVSEVLARFPVYRTYAVGAGAGGEDAETIRGVVEEVRAERPGLGPVLDTVGRVLLGEGVFRPDGAPEKRAEALARFQQLCAPLAAKGVEDTALYRYLRLVSANEVGGDPERIGISRKDFFAFLADRRDAWPHAMNALSTHDSKRSEDVRARIDVLSEMPEEWARRCRFWQQANREKKEICDGSPVPDANVEYLLYQTLVGSFPFDPGDLKDYGRRIADYMKKAVREAKERTSWLSPDTDYEEALGRFIERLLFPGSETDPFLADLSSFAALTADFGAMNSLSQTLLKIAAPGVPDFYQGTELFDFSLVDPDNRRPVDFPRRRKLLDEIRSRRRSGPPGEAPGVTQTDLWDRRKLYLVYTALQVRRQHPALFTEGRIQPLETTGRFSDHVVAFARIRGARYCVVAVPRLLTEVVPDGRLPLGEVWQDTALCLPGGFPTAWTGALSRKKFDAVESMPVSDLFSHFPAALTTGSVPA